MALFNEIGAGRYNRYLQKLFHMKAGPPARQLGSDVVPVFPFFTGVEHRFLDQTGRFAAITEITGGAAQFAAFRLRNPSTSNVIVTIENILVSGIASSIINGALQIQTVDRANGVQQTRLDSRGTPTGAAKASTDTNLGAALIATIFKLVLPGNQTFQLISCEDQELTVLPGDGFDIGPNGANAEMDLTIMWRERALEESEVSKGT